MGESTVSVLLHFGGLVSVLSALSIQTAFKSEWAYQDTASLRASQALEYPQCWGAAATLRVPVEAMRHLMERSHVLQRKLHLGTN